MVWISLALPRRLYMCLCHAMALVPFDIVWTISVAMHSKASSVKGLKINEAHGHEAVIGLF